MVWTSAPWPPTGPPPAFGAFFARVSCVAVILGVACTTGLAASFVLSAVFTILVSFVAALGGAFVGTSGAGAVVTTPTAGGPAGAAMSSTLYIGGIDTLEAECRSSNGSM